MSIFLPKVRDVGVALQNRFAFSLGLYLASVFVSAPALAGAAPDSRGSSVPSASSSSTTCELLSRGPGVDLLQQEALLHSSLKDFIEALQQGKFDELARFFNKRAKVDSKIGDKIRILLANRYDEPIQYSVFRVWRLRSPSAGKELVRGCPESQDATLISQFGYEKQFAVWLQIMGQNELGRIILALAPDKDRVSIIGFRLQQWSQQGSDWEAWTLKAQNELKAGDKTQAYLSFDVAQKLLTGEDFVIYPQQRILRDQRDQIFSQNTLVNQINQDAKIQSIAYVGSLLARDGTGLLIREIVTPKESTVALQELCRKRARTLQDLGWLKEKSGLRCNYIYAGMDPAEDSQLGGFYLSPSDLKNPQK